MAIDPRLATLGVSAGVLAFIAIVRDRRGDPPAPAMDAAIPTGIEVAIADRGSIATRRFGRRVLVGRAASADIIVDDPRVSRLHARIEMRDDGAYVEDLESRNGTMVDGAAVSTSRRLVSGDEIIVGPASIIFRGVGTWK